MNISKSMKVALAERNIKRKDLDAKLGFVSGVTSKITCGEYFPSISKLALISSVLGYKLSEFIILGELEDEKDEAAEAYVFRGKHYSVGPIKEI